MTVTDKKKVLGRGLDTLLPASRGAVVPSIHATQMTGDVVKEVPINQIDRNPYQTRTRIAEDALNELAASIKASGVVQPIIVRPQPNGRYQLIAGERRWLASERAGKTTVPAVIRQV